MKNLVRVTTTIDLAERIANLSTEYTVDNNTAVNNTAVSNTPLISNQIGNTTPVVNNTPVNKVEETIPKTGENDIFIVAGVGVIALAIGAVAYRNSKKYSI